MIYHGRFGSSMFVGPMHDGPHGPCCRLYSLPGWEEDLQDFAREIGLKPAWFQQTSSMPHFVLTEWMRSRALARGAVEASLRDFHDALKGWRVTNAKNVARALAEQSAEPEGEIRNDRRANLQAERPATEDEARQFSEKIADLRRRMKAGGIAS